MAAPSTLIEVDGYPPQGGYAEFRAVHRSFGGEAAGGAYVLARLGIPTKLAGTRLPPGPAAEWVLTTLAGAGVDCSSLHIDPEATVEEYVVTSGGDRTILAAYGSMLADRRWDPPSRTDIAASRLVCLDPFFGAESEQAAEWSREAGVPYVTIDTEPDSPLAVAAAAIVVSKEFTDRTFGEAGPAELFDAYAQHCPGLVVLTRGGEPIWFGRSGEEPRRQPALEVEVVDTAGAGDSFRAGVIRGMLRSEPDDEVVRSAAAIAAMVCGTAPGVLRSPNEAQLRSFLTGH